MKIIWNIAGVAGLLLGALWVLQGMNLLGGAARSFMTGRVTWIGNGALLIAFAAGLLVWANRVRPPKA